MTLRIKTIFVEISESGEFRDKSFDNSLNSLKNLEFSILFYIFSEIILCLVFIYTVSAASINYFFYRIALI